MTQDAMRAAIELHRPRGYDLYAHEVAEPAAAQRWRCNECGRPVQRQGCRTWQTANQLPVCR